MPCNTSSFGFFLARFLLGFRVWVSPQSNGLLCCHWGLLVFVFVCTELTRFTQELLLFAFSSAGFACSAVLAAVAVFSCQIFWRVDFELHWRVDSVLTRSLGFVLFALFLRCVWHCFSLNYPCCLLCSSFPCSKTCFASLDKLNQILN